MASNTTKMVEVYLEQVFETYEDQDALVNMVSFIEPNAGGMQNAGNVVWRPVDQHAPSQSGWDLTGNETGILERAYPARLGTPNNDYVRVRIDDLRDKTYWERRGRKSGKRQQSDLNLAIASLCATQGSMFYRSSDTNGFDFIGEAQALMNERQVVDNGRCFVMNDRDTLLFASDLSSRQTIKGRPADAWNTGQIGSNVAQFDVYTGSYLPNLTGGASPATTVTGDQSFAPEAGAVADTDGGGTVTNNDYRFASVVVADSSGYTVGDKVQFENTAVAVQSITLDDQQATGQPMTFAVVSKPDATHLGVYPRPIALDDTSLLAEEAAYANINTQILNTAVVVRLNVDTTNKTNIFFDKEAIEVIGGKIPMDLMNEFDGFKVINETMKNGVEMYFVYDGNIDTLNLRYRLFTWWGVTMRDPANAGVALTI